jgi:xanthosine utilization system XapX-like protein
MNVGNLLVVQRGMLISFFIFAVTHVNAPLGTIVAIVGILASCHPMPVLIIVAPAYHQIFHSRLC